MFRFTIVSGIIGIASESSHNGNWVDGKLANGIMMTIAAILFVCNGLDLIFLSLSRKIFKGMNLTIRKKYKRNHAMCWLQQKFRDLPKNWNFIHLKFLSYSNFDRK